ncbi:GAF domain-containing protein [Desulfoprunum benzoelyticum]|uniref:histidine kinase n=1 Tax=Desulfoprunum benzoelyticum TaxID=1506996 RepID=A0A840V4F6_9BACT|nr:GAF domain-containing protein [Desulfoprunum benzoelyticum]MBB5347981.1 PAS domain S-box-containing protein [Desulfoprunum benzoelyticum]MBM9530394.1 GAF domain-containing protein [Desulfoprunum benzoelyticum]
MDNSREYRYLQVFHQVTRMISMVRDSHQVMANIVHSLPELLAIDACTIRLLDQASGAFVLGAAAGLSPEYLARPDVDSRETIATAASGHPVAMRAVADSPHRSFREAALREGIESVLTLPIAFQERVIGIMRLLTRTPREFAEDEILFSVALAEQIGIAISNGRMFRQLEQQVDFLHELQSISQLVNSTLDLDRVLQTIVELLPRSLRAQGCTIRLLTPQSNDLVLAASAGLSPEYLDRGEVVDEKNTIQALRGEAVAIQDVARDDRVQYHEHMEKEGIRSLLAVPIKVMDEVIGIIRVLARERRTFSQTEIDFSLAVAEAGGSAITNARTYRKITLLFNQIEEHERFLANILDCIRPQLLVVDRQGRAVMANRAFLEINGLQESEFLGMEYGRLCQAVEGNPPCPMQQVMTTGRMAISVQQVQAEDGTRWYERTATPMTGESGAIEFVIEIIRDITAQRRLEAEQAERSKLAGVIEMAGAVAHEINSPLFAALGTAQMMEGDLAGSELEEDIRTVVRNLKTISELTAKMTVMTGYSSRDYVGETRIVDL